MLARTLILRAGAAWPSLLRLGTARSASSTARSTSAAATAAPIRNATPPAPPKESFEVKDPWDMHPPTDDTYDPILFRPVQRPNESDDSKRRRLVWQSRKRGILECDLLLSTFAREHLASLTREQLDVYDALLEENDWDIYYWATKKKTVPAHVDTEVMAMIQIVAENHGRKILKMPELDEFGKLSGGGANK